MIIQPMTKDHWPEVKKIYEEAIETGTITVSQTMPDYKEWDESHLKKVRLVALNDEGEVMGWVALSPKSSVPAYVGYVEISIYVSFAHHRKGVGKRLLEEAIVESEKEGIWTLEAHIMEENKGSIRLHEKYGFRYVGWREHLGQVNGEWKNTVLYERRSKTVGYEDK